MSEVEGELFLAREYLYSDMIGKYIWKAREDLSALSFEALDRLRSIERYDELDLSMSKDFYHRQGGRRPGPSGPG